MTFDQAEFEIRCEWGRQGVCQLAPISDVVIIVDVLSFSTCLEIANSRGAVIFPYRWKDESARDFAASLGAELAQFERGSDGYSLSPASLMSIPENTRLVLPSPNGSTMSLATGATPTLAGCLRNCRAVARAAMKYGRRIAVIPAGEQWKDRSLRPSFEDLAGAGAIINHLQGILSPEAKAAGGVYSSALNDLRQLLKQCISGRELIERGFELDVELASELDISECIPTLMNGTYVHHLA
jgi:2-phosphosulfolactate phosphatase